MDCGKVSKVITTSKYEYKDRNLKEKWNEIFQEYENQIKPLERRSSVVRELLPCEIYQRIAPILNLKPLPYTLNPEYVEKDRDIESSIIFFPKEDFDEQVVAESDDYLDVTLSSDLKVDPPSSKDEPLDEVIQINPYLKFLKKPEHRAAAWRPKDELVVPPGSSMAAATPLLVDPKRTLSEKANAVTNAIIKDFCTWIKSLGGVETSPMTEDTVNQLFEVGFDTPAARALCVRVKELPVVTNNVARARNLPERSISAGLHREINWDIKAEKTPPKLIGFGTALPIRPPLRYKPPRNNTKKRWLDFPSLPKDLATMKVVWEGITKLRSTKSYCQWLIDHPKVPSPTYLRQLGILRSDLKQETSSETESESGSERESEFYRSSETNDSRAKSK